MLNGTITANEVASYITENLRIDMPFRITKGSDIEKARTIVNNVLANDSNVLKYPAPRVAVNNLGENGIELLALPYTNFEAYWDVHTDTREKIVIALGEAGYESPQP